MVLGEGLTAVLIFILVYQALGGTVAGRAIFDANGIMPHLKVVPFAAPDTKYQLRVEEGVVTPQRAIGAEFQSPCVGIVEDILASICGTLPLHLVARGIEKGRGSIEQCAGLEGSRCDTGCTAHFRPIFRRVGNGQIGCDGITLVDNELHDILSRRTMDVVSLAICQCGRHQGHVAVGLEQFKIEVSPEEAQLVRERLHLRHPVLIVGVIQPIRDICLVDLL